ncbi:MAG: hypothetical protein O2930_07775 [Acidobacteria bacterium]|nr:hypothetical protein [Acidobacteriota bacterium]
MTSLGSVRDAPRDTIVLTATFRAPLTPTLVVRDEGTRIQQYMCALVAWGGTRRVRRIIFGENSHTRFDFSRIVGYLEAAGKEVELLIFDGNEGSPRFGKGFGEGEILERVYRHSKLLRQTDAFYKVTGRLFVRNFDAVSDATQSQHAFRRKYGKPGNPSKIDTTFFKCGLDLFERRLLDAYREIDDAKRMFIEHMYFNRLSETDAGEFSLRPELVGQQASTGKVYGAYDEEVVRTATAMSTGNSRV